jgi:hypothetical protein
MLNAIYGDVVEEKCIVAITFNPAFKPLFEIATTREGGDVTPITTTPPDLSGLEASTSW